MYSKRIKVFIVVTLALLLVCLLRLTQMQLVSHSSVQEQIRQLKRQRGLLRYLKTVRGRILDRNGEVLATDQLGFELHIDYTLSCIWDERVRLAELLKPAGKHNTERARQNIEAKIDELQRIIHKCSRFEGVEPSAVEERIRKINDFIWSRRVFHAWRNNFPDSQLFKDYNNVLAIPLSRVRGDFEKSEPNSLKRILLVSKTDIAPMHRSLPLVELKTEDDVFAAQLEFMNFDGIKIVAEPHRFYPYGSVAAQTIGWVGPATSDEDKQLFEDDQLLSYLDGELCGREDGVEYVCEAFLRGRRGEVSYDIDGRQISRAGPQFGCDIKLTLDISLQQRIENYLADCNFNPNCKAAAGVVLIDVATGEILSLVSTPVFDLNRIRGNYGLVVQDPNEPLRNRAINKQFPPGSVVKPLILVAGLESEAIRPDEVITCPAQKAASGWPSCWIYNRHRTGHSDQWQNNARNALKGSCNIYFSRLAARMEPVLIQRWLSRFGYGRTVALVSDLVACSDSRQNRGRALRTFRQAGGIICSGSSVPLASANPITECQLRPLEMGECRYFGIGQGNLRASPLQVANSMACLARDGIYKPLRLFIPCNACADEAALIAGEPNQSQTGFAGAQDINALDLDISDRTLAVVRDGMRAVVDEPGGTAYKEFAPVLSGFAAHGITVYGKTGSTEQPANAWFAGFAQDSTGRSIAIAVIVEGGEHGSSEAAPLARDIIQFCAEAKYIGRN